MLARLLDDLLGPIHALLINAGLSIDGPVVLLVVVLQLLEVVGHHFLLLLELGDLTLVVTLVLQLIDRYHLFVGGVELFPIFFGLVVF